jgi:hypothetical protein
MQRAGGLSGCRGGTVSGPSLWRARAFALALGGALGLACGASSGGSTAKLGAGAACTCAGDDAAVGSDTLCGGATYTACDTSLPLPAATVASLPGAHSASLGIVGDP